MAAADIFRPAPPPPLVPMYRHGYADVRFNAHYGLKSDMARAAGGWASIGMGASCLKMRGCQPHIRQEHPHDRRGKEPVAPAHDRRHDDPQIRAEDPT